MNAAKKKSFNEKMGKAKHYPRHQNLSKGGMVDKRKHFDSGGVAAGTTQNHPQLTANDVEGSDQQGSLQSIPNFIGSSITNPIGAVGGAAQGIAQAFTSQNGYQAQLAPTTQLNYEPTIAAGANTALNAGTVNSAVNAEQNLAGQYGDIAAGRGPNPAQAALNQNTATNVANTAALQAGQRGSAANAGLLARQIGQQGAATQQNAVGQEATLAANQQLGALGAQAGLQNQIATQGLGEQGIGSNIYATGAGANNAQNTTNVSNYAQAQGLNQATAQANTDATNKTSGGLIGGVGSLLAALHEGGEVKKFDDGGPVLTTIQPLPGTTTQPMSALNVDTSMPNPNNSTIATGAVTPSATSNSAQSIIGKALEGKSKKNDSDPSGFKGLGSGIGTMLARGGQVHPGPHKSHVANYLFAEGGGTDKVPALVSPKEVYLNPHQVKEVVERGADPMKIGYHIPGKDKVKRNSEKNDVIPMDLDDGGVVLPIDITTHKEASEKGRKFVETAHNKRYMKKPKGI